MKRKNNLGFSVIEVMFFILVIGLLVGGAYYVGSRQKTAKTASSAQTTTTSKATSNTYKNTEFGYSLILPEGWSYNKGQVSKLDNGQVNTDYQGNPIIEPDTIMPNGSDIHGTMGITEVMAETSSLDAKAYFESNGFGRANFDSGANTTTNGYSVYTATLGGQSPAKTVVVKSGDKAVQFFYYTNVSMNKNAALCEKIINSIKFN